VYFDASSAKSGLSSRVRVHLAATHQDGQLEPQLPASLVYTACMSPASLLLDLGSVTIKCSQQAISAKQGEGFQSGPAGSRPTTKPPQTPISYLQCCFIKLRATCLSDIRNPSSRACHPVFRTKHAKKTAGHSKNTHVAACVNKPGIWAHW
jgi:hypothetical protein